MVGLASSAARLAALAVPVAVQVVFILANDGDRAGVLRAVAFAVLAVVIRGVGVEARTLIAGVAVIGGGRRRASALTGVADWRFPTQPLRGKGCSEPTA